jgi:chondroitin 4-sulfotransferase 11
MKPFIFVHIPKTGGISVLRCLNIDYRPLTSHSPLTYYPKYLRETAFSFTFVRNPFDRIVSAYNYLIQHRGNTADSHFADEHLKRHKNFNSFVKDFENNETLQTWLHFLPMTSFIDDEIKFVGRFENLQNDFNDVCDNIGILRIPLNKINVSKHAHYSTYYNKKSKKIVENFYKKDINRFGYSFENRV